MLSILNLMLIMSFLIMATVIVGLSFYYERKLPTMNTKMTIIINGIFLIIFLGYYICNLFLSFSFRHTFLGYPLIWLLMGMPFIGFVIVGYKRLWPTPAQKKEVLKEEQRIRKTVALKIMSIVPVIVLLLWFLNTMFLELGLPGFKRFVFLSYFGYWFGKIITIVVGMIVIGLISLFSIWLLQKFEKNNGGLEYIISGLKISVLVKPQIIVNLMMAIFAIVLCLGFGFEIYVGTGGVLMVITMLILAEMNVGAWILIWRIVHSGNYND